MSSPTGRIFAAAVVVLAGAVASCSPPSPVFPDVGTTQTEPGPETTSASPSKTTRSDAPSTTSSSSATPTPSALPSGETATSGPPDRDPEPSATSTSGQDDPAKPTAPTDPPTESGSGVVPTVVYAGVGPDSRVRVNGFVPGVVEDGGTCSALLTGTSGTSSASAPAFADATATWCDELVLDPVDGDTASWRVVVTYSSSAHQGSSISTAVSNL